MKTHDLIQGTPEWHTFRAEHFTASDAAAMMGQSSYKTRQQLLHEKATGLTPEVDAATQRRFDDGHRFEALARPLAEEIIGEELYPIVGSEGKFAASFDGLTMMGDVNFEHKTLNATIEACECAEDLPLEYHIQVQHQHMVSGAKKTLFMASKWDENDQLIDKREFWIERDENLIAQIVAAWGQFEKDLSEYVAPDPVVEVVGRAPDDLPALRIEVTGMVTASNLREFKTTADQVLAKINTDLNTDEDFANAEKTIKWCSEVEARLAAAKQHALSQTATIDELFRTIDSVSEDTRQKRLTLSKAVKALKDARKTEIVLAAREVFLDYINQTNTKIVPVVITGINPDFNTAVKGKKMISSVENAVATELAHLKVAIDRRAREIGENLTFFREYAKGHEFLFADLATLGQKAHDDFKATVNLRISQHQEAERQRREAEAAAAKAEAEKVPETAPTVAETVAEEPEAPAPTAPVNTKASAPGNGTETVLLIRHAFTDQFIRAKVEECLAEYGVSVESVELMGDVRGVAA